MDNGDTRHHWQAVTVHDPNQRWYPSIVGPVMYLAIWPTQDTH